MREDGLPVASRLANNDELFALCEVVSEVEQRRHSDEHGAPLRRADSAIR